jgi:hypothetical protein
MADFSSEEDVLRENMTNYITLYGLIEPPMLRQSIAVHVYNILHAIAKKRGIKIDTKLEAIEKMLEEAVNVYYDGTASKNWKDTWILSDKAMKECIKIALEYELISPKTAILDPLKMHEVIRGGARVRNE